LHTPAPLHVSAWLHNDSPWSPHAKPDGRKPSAGQLPAPSHFSTTSQSFTAARHVNVVGSLFTWQAPDPLHVSGLSQTVSLALPHALPEGELQESMLSLQMF
jgi:hypothetical protein